MTMTNPPPVAPVWAPQKMYVQFAENGNIRKWTSGPSSDADHMQVAKVYFRLDGDFAALVLAGNKLLDTIDAHDSEKEPLSSNHPDVHAFSNLLDKMPPANMQSVASGELEHLRQEHAFMKDQIQKLDQIMTNSIKENDGPNRVNVDGIWYEGPVVESYFKVLRKMQEAYRLVLERVS